MIEFAKLLRTQLGQNVRTVLAHIAAFGMEGDEPNAEQAENCETLHPVGFVSRPAKDSPTAEAVIVRDGDEVHVLFFLDKTQDLHDCEEGEAQVYSPKEPSCRIRIRATGSIEITAKSGQDVIVNGGTAKVGRVGDQIRIPNVIFNPGTGGASLQMNGVTLGMAPQNVTGTIVAGADHFKA